MALIEINRNPGKRDLLVFGVGLPILAGLLGWRRWSVGSPLSAELCWGIGGALTLAFAAAPRLRKRIYLAWMMLVFPIGWIASHAILGAIYFLVFTPARLLLALAGHDPMNRKPDRAATSYWTQRGEPRSKTRYFSQS